MTRLLIISLVLVFAATAAFAQDGTIRIYEDAAGTNCEVSDAGDGGVFVPEFYTYVVHNNVPNGAGGSEWAAPVPACATFQWASDSYAAGMVPVGDTQNGNGVGYGGCLGDPILIVTMTCFSMENTPACCEWCIEPNQGKAQVEGSDCQTNLTLPVGLCSPVNGDGSCDCEATVPTEQSTWGNVKALYGADN